MTKRIIVSVILLLSATYMPFWLTAIIALGGIVYFRYYIEAIIIMFLVDLLFGAEVKMFHGFHFAASISALIILLIAEYIRERTRLNE